MKFQEIKNYKYVKYVVYIKSFIVGTQIITKDQKIFENDIHAAISYVKELKKTMKEYPELYTDSKIIMEKIVTKSDTYEVLEGD